VNWLAHVFLSEPDVEARLGNLLADLVKRRDREGMSPAFLRGTQQHQLVDAFTDYHPVVGRSKRRIGEDYGRFAGILIDVFYDHFLARSWGRYCPQPLGEFTAGFYAAVRACPMTLPAEASEAVERMLTEDRLTSYRRVEGIEASLRRVSQRLSARIGRLFALEKAVGELTANFDGLAEDFDEFFPQLRRHVEQNPMA
jgi:acyl carrier protein phosphodiesterase